MGKSVMSKLKSNEIIKLLDAIVGSADPIGESNYDEKAADNLSVLIDITNWCLDGVANARDYIGRYEYSMSKIGFDAQCAMQDWLDWLKERLGEDEYGNKKSDW